MNINGNFLPKLLVMYPKSMLPSNAPTCNNDAIQEASSMLIIPDASGVSFDVSRATADDVHPSSTPKPIVLKLTIWNKWVSFGYLFCVFSSSNYPLTRQYIDISHFVCAQHSLLHPFNFALSSDNELMIIACWTRIVRQNTVLMEVFELLIRDNFHQ